LLGVCRDALRRGHTGRIVLFHGSRDVDGLYKREELAALAAEHDNLEVHASLTGRADEPGTLRGRILDHAFADGVDRQGWMVYLCGIPEMVYDGRVRAVLAGVDRADIRADPFEYARPYNPDDATKMAHLAPEPELWAALAEGPGLRRILTSFYDQAYEDSRLAPFFHRTTKDRAIGQQYAFLADLLSGSKNYFGLRPFNAHHWMVISDELFDYREAMIEACMRRHGLPEHLLRRWAALHERFRRDIVKASARGMIIDGKEQPIEPPQVLEVEVATVCDGCLSEIGLGQRARFVHQTGQLFCLDCDGAPAQAG
jgi:truncated hemoglobin YjbI